MKANFKVYLEMMERKKCLWMNEMVTLIFSRLKLFLSIHFVAYGIYYDNK